MEETTIAQIEIEKAQHDRGSGRSVEIEQPIHPQWIVGFTDGEGSFSIGICLEHRSNARFCVRLRPRFSISQGNREILERIKDYFGFGSINKHSSPSPKHVNWSQHYQYVVHTKDDCGAIVKFFRANPTLLKQADFELWATVVELTNNGKHYRDDDIIKIAEIRDKLNLHKKRNCRYHSIEFIKRLIKANPRVCIHYSQDELDFVKNHWQKYSDNDLADQLKRSPKAIKGLRIRKLNLNRRKGSVSI